MAIDNRDNNVARPDRAHNACHRQRRRFDQIARHRCNQIGVEVIESGDNPTEGPFAGPLIHYKLVAQRLEVAAVAAHYHHRRGTRLDKSLDGACDHGNAANLYERLGAAHASARPTRQYRAAK